MKAVLVVSDLFFAARIRETAAHLGVAALVVDKSERVEDVTRREMPDLVILDLNDKTHSAIETIETIRRAPDIGSTRIVGFLSHIQVDLAEAAARAGCDQVLPRSKFTQILPEILAGAP
ncbi:MAG: hypothetical protein HY650_07035 [Acidobacteria bacterium]|nr:hypothetical protein [Acidobacteriota bacterium]